MYFLVSSYMSFHICIATIHESLLHMSNWYLDTSIYYIMGMKKWMVKWNIYCGSILSCLDTSTDLYTGIISFLVLVSMSSGSSGDCICGHDLGIHRISSVLSRTLLGLRKNRCLRPWSRICMGYPVSLEGHHSVVVETVLGAMVSGMNDTLLKIREYSHHSVQNY